MIRSMFSGVSGLRAHQSMMDVIGNNIANVNTIGFKAAQVTFADILSQTIAGASAPQGGSGGINAQQVGLGVKLASITDIHTQGALQSTGRVTDLAIQGDGFFVVTDGARNLYTRAGSFTMDGDGNLVNNTNGYILQGWMADITGSINTNAAVENLSIPAGQSMQPKSTENVTFSGNIDASQWSDPLYSQVVTITVRDDLGAAHELALTFTPGAIDNDWDWTALIDNDPATTGSGTITFNPDGTYDSDLSSTIDLVLPNTNPLSITPDFSTLTQYASAWTAQASTQDGYASGILKGISVSGRGEIFGIFTNGLSLELGQVALANFNNPSGLQKEGENFYIPSANSGLAMIGESGTGGRGGITAGALEMANVDLAKEFTNMIIAQRGFQANSRIITTSDDMLQELVNLKR